MKNEPPLFLALTPAVIGCASATATVFAGGSEYAVTVDLFSTPTT